MVFEIYFLTSDFELLADQQQRSSTVTAILYPDGINDSWRNKLKEDYNTQVIGAQDHLKGKNGLESVRWVKRN